MKEQEKELEVQETPKIRLVAYMDSPSVATGFGTVSRNILKMLHDTGKYEIIIFGINYWGTPHEFPYQIHPTGINVENDPFGRQSFVNFVRSTEFDMLFVLQDLFILDFIPELIGELKRIGRKFTSVLYFPIDGKIKPQWAEVVEAFDKSIAYTEFGKNTVLEYIDDKSLDLRVIPHGVDTAVFKPLADEEIIAFRKQYFGERWKRFIVMNLNRNQPRKDIPRTLMAFAKFKSLVPNSLLYLHMTKDDEAGWELNSLCESFGLTGKDVVFPKGHDPNQGYPIEVVNQIYNAVDCIISTTLGEGMGLGWLEAMSAGKPVVMPDNTAMTEFITEDRGFLVKSGTNANLWTILLNDNEIPRPLVDVGDLVAKMLHVHNEYKTEVMHKAITAQNWTVKEMDWRGKIKDQWLAVFSEAEEELKGKIKNSAEAVANSSFSFEEV